jgi:hypothetical protein
VRQGWPGTAAAAELGPDPPRIQPSSSVGGVLLILMPMIASDAVAGV